MNAPSQQAGGAPPTMLITLAVILAQFAAYRSGRNFTVRCLSCPLQDMEWKLSQSSAILGDVITDALTHWQEFHA